MNGMKGSDSDILQSNVLDSYVDDHSSVSGFCTPVLVQIVFVFRFSMT